MAPIDRFTPGPAGQVPRWCEDCGRQGLPPVFVKRPGGPWHHFCSDCWRWRCGLPPRPFVMPAPIAWEVST